ncbi:MAG TPA: hypothetical protein VMV79_04185, partial [Alphaproteobacteria bacterium]|nr:hypothetical protein [Alphaproteobacteria bacterium]
MLEDFRIPRSDEPQAEIWYYHQKVYEGGSQSEIHRMNLPITTDEMDALSGLRTEAILNLPKSVIEYARQEKMPLDQIAAIHVMPTQVFASQARASFFVAGVSRQGTTDIE